MRRSRFAGRVLLAVAVLVAPVAPVAPAGAAADPVLEALEDELDLEQGLALLAELLGRSPDEAELAEVLLRDAAALRATPLDVNSASFAELVRVPLLDPVTAAAIVARREAGGPIRSIEELIAVPGLGRQTVAALRPYLVVGPGRTREISEDGTAPVEHAPVEWSLRARASARPSEPASAGGDPAEAARTYVRLRLSRPPDIQIGAACEKDAGEASLLDHNALFVSWSGSAGRSPGGPVEPHNVALIAGDFTGTWGQGLVLSGLRFPSPRALPRRRDRLRGYDGASELGARRGLVVEVSRGRGAAWLVGARTRLDAAIDDDGRVSSIRSSGTHRTDGERRGANALEESLVGARAAVTPITGLRVGATFLRFRFDPPLAPGDPERQRFRFAGDELDVRAADVRLTAGRWVLGGEVALTSSGGRAALASARVRDGAVGVRFGFGWLSRAYWSPLGGGVPGFSSGANGLGGWVGAEYRIAPRLKPWVEILVAGRPWRPYSDELPGGFVTWSGGIEIPAGYLGDVEIELRERAARVGRGDPPESVVEASRRVRVTFRAAGEPPLSVYVERAASHARGVEEGSALALGARGEAALSQAVAIVVGVTQVARRGRARPLVQYEPPLPGSFGLVSLSEPGSRWYARLVAGLSARVGLSVRIGGGPGRGRTELGLSIDTRG